MTIPTLDDLQPRRGTSVPTSALREAFAVALILAGAAGLAAAAYRFDPLLGAATLSAEAVALGVTLGLGD